MPLRTVSITRSQDGGAVVEGIASTVETDSFNTRMSPSLYRSFLRDFERGEIPLITVSHLYHSPIGRVTRLTTSKDEEKLIMRGKLDASPITAALLARADELKLGLSIGMGDDAETEEDPDDGVEVYRRATLLEIALTTRPANPGSWVTNLSGGTKRSVPAAYAEDAENLVGKTFARFLTIREEQIGGH